MIDRCHPRHPPPMDHPHPATVAVVPPPPPFLMVSPHCFFSLTPHLPSLHHRYPLADGVTRSDGIHPNAGSPPRSGATALLTPDSSSYDRPAIADRPEGNITAMYHRFDGEDRQGIVSGRSDVTSGYGEATDDRSCVDGRIITHTLSNMFIYDV